MSSGVEARGTPSRAPRTATLVAAALALGFAAVLAKTAPEMGYTRDEGYYFKAAEQYSAWWDTLLSARFFEAFGQKELDLRFGYNTEHPALVKLLQGITFRVFHRALGLTGAAQGFRVTGFAFAALGLFATFLLGRRLVSARVGLGALVLAATVPRYFYDAHLACFDVPITAMWTLSLWAFWRAFDVPHEPAVDRGAPAAVRPRRAAALAGVVFGLSLATKLNAMFLPIVFVSVWLYGGGLGAFGLTRGPSGSYDLRLPPVPWVLVACLTLGPLVFLACSPYLWHDTFTRIGAYVGFHLNHEHYPIRYFGTVYVKPPFPWHFSWVMSALTLPGPLLALGGVGVLATAARIAAYVTRRAARSPGDVLLLVATLFPIALISLPGTPIFGGVKHWYNAIPTLSILAARTLFDGVDWLGVVIPALRRAAAPALFAVAALPGVLGIAASHPVGIGYYNELAGGLRGGASLGMQRSFWGGVSRGVLPEARRFPPGTRMFFDHTNYDAYAMYVREGTLPGSISFANGPEQAEAATLFEDREGYPNTEVAAFSRLGTRPIAGVYVDEVTFVQLYAPLAGEGRR